MSETYGKKRTMKQKNEILAMRFGSYSLACAAAIMMFSIVACWKNESGDTLPGGTQAQKSEPIIFVDLAPKTLDEESSKVGTVLHDNKFETGSKDNDGNFITKTYVMHAIGNLAHDGDCWIFDSTPSDGAFGIFYFSEEFDLDISFQSVVGSGIVQKLHLKLGLNKGVVYAIGQVAEVGTNRLVVKWTNCEGKVEGVVAAYDTEVIVIVDGKRRSMTELSVGDWVTAEIKTAEDGKHTVKKVVVGEHTITLLAPFFQDYIVNVGNDFD